MKQRDYREPNIQSDQKLKRSHLGESINTSIEFQESVTNILRAL